MLERVDRRRQAAVNTEDPLLNDRDEDGDGYSTCEEDCDDSNADLSPRDADGDGVSLCAGDCDDEDAANFPGNSELCDGADNDCDGELFPGELDLDLDGYGICEGDCDDSNPVANPADADGDGGPLRLREGLVTHGTLVHKEFTNGRVNNQPVT